MNKVGHDYLGSSSHGGWLFIRHSHQVGNTTYLKITHKFHLKCEDVEFFVSQTVADLLLPPPPLLFAVLIMRWEVDINSITAPDPILSDTFLSPHRFPGLVWPP